MCCKVRYEAVLMLLIRCTATRQSWWSVRRVPLPEATPYLTLDILAPATSRLVGSLAVFHLHNVPTNLSEMSPSIMTTGVLRLSLCQAGIVNGLANVDVENVFCKAERPLASTRPYSNVRASTEAFVSPSHGLIRPWLKTLFGEKHGIPYVENLAKEFPVSGWFGNMGMHILARGA